MQRAVAVIVYDGRTYHINSEEKHNIRPNKTRLYIFRYMYSAAAGGGNADSKKFLQTLSYTHVTPPVAEF